MQLFEYFLKANLVVVYANGRRLFNGNHFSGSTRECSPLYSLDKLTDMDSGRYHNLPK